MRRAIEKPYNYFDILKIAKEEKIFSLETPTERLEKEKLEDIGLIQVVSEGNAGQFQSRGNSHHVKLTKKGKRAIQNFKDSLHTLSYVYTKWKKLSSLFSRKEVNYLSNRVPYFNEI